MALSFYSNWEMDNLDPILDPAYDDRSEVADALIAFLDPTDVPIDSLFENTQMADELFDHTGTPSSNLLPCHSDPSVLTLPSKLRPEAVDEFGCCKCPKRPRSCSDLYRPPRVVPGGGSYSGPYVGAAAGTNGGWQSTSAEFVVPPAASGGGSGREKKSGGCLSAQSMAARERRKRISEKTQELGRLIPGGNKMNTAEMFQAAFKYVKFLQAQVGILEVMDSVRGSRGSPGVGEQLQVLVTSPAIQEKLYGEGKCVVSTQAVKALAEEAAIKSTRAISRDLDRFAQSM